jgi:hypothetical protein
MGEKKTNYNDVLAINKFVYDMLADNPIGEYHRMEDIYDVVLFKASEDARKEDLNNVWPDDVETANRAMRPHMLKRYVEFIDKDRVMLLKELERRGVDERKALDITKALDKIRSIDDKKEAMDALAKDAYVKCAFNLVLYEILR